MSGYNGWSNFETWSIFCHFQPETKQEVDFAKACFADAYEELPDFIRPLIDSSKINWGEIYTAVYDADDDDEQDAEEPTYGWQVVTSANGTGLDSVVFASEQEAQKACEVCKKFSWEDTEFFVVKTTLQPTCTFDEWHAQDWGIDDEQEEQDEPTTPTIMICNNFEWIRENCGVDFDGLDGETIRELVDLLTQDLSELLTLSAFQVEFPTDGKSTYHGWNGFRGFKHQFGICGTFDPLTDEQYDKVGELIQESQDMIEHHVDRIRRRRFQFKSDSESGILTADSFADACQQLRDMYTPEIVEDGGWGWVEDHDGQRFVIGEVP